MITKDDILAAYAKTGLYPRQRVFYNATTPDHPSKDCGCAVGALEIALGRPRKDICQRIIVSPEVKKLHGHDVFFGLIDGFDGNPFGMSIDPNQEKSSDYRSAYIAGRDTAAHFNLPVWQGELP